MWILRSSWLRNQRFPVDIQFCYWFPPVCIIRTLWMSNNYYQNWNKWFKRRYLKISLTYDVSSMQMLAERAGFKRDSVRTSLWRFWTPFLHNLTSDSNLKRIWKCFKLYALLSSLRGIARVVFRWLLSRLILLKYGYRHINQTRIWYNVWMLNFIRRSVIIEPLIMLLFFNII